MPARLDHVGLDVVDYEQSKAFYLRALEPLGLRLMMEPAPRIGGFGADLVHDFHAAALSAGGTDDGRPGVREIYHPLYYVGAA